MKKNLPANIFRLKDVVGHWLLFICLLLLVGAEAKASNRLPAPPPCSATQYSYSDAACDSYLFQGVTLYSSGTYIDTVVNYLGCDSIITLTLTINQPSAYTYNDWLCPGHVYNFNGILYGNPGQYTDTLTNYLGCDSVITLNLNLSSGQTSSNLITDFACANSTYNFHGQLLTFGGIFSTTLTNYIGCDSFLTLKLTFLPLDTQTLTIHACGVPYVFGGQALTASGTYYDTLVNQHGCDSSIVLNYTYSNGTGSSSTLYDTICQNHYIQYHGQYIFNAGTYTFHLVNYQGCDSFVTLNMAVTPSSTSTRTDSICPGILTPVQVGIYTYSLIINSPVTYYLNSGIPNYRGCDSTIIVSFVLKPIPTVHAGADTTVCAGTACQLTASGCANYSWSGGFGNGAVFYPSATTNFIVTGYNLQGCSDKDTVKVTVVNNPSQPNVTNNAGVLTSSVATNVQWYFNNAAISGATTNTYNTNNVGGYYKVCVTNAAGCTNCSNSVYIPVINGIDETIAGEQTKMYPSPFNYILTIEPDITLPNNNSRVEVFDALGRTVFQSTLPGRIDIATGSWATGNYFIKISNDEGVVTKRMMVKQ